MKQLLNIRSAAGIGILLAAAAVTPALSTPARAAVQSAGIRFAYHRFTESNMKDCYAYAPILAAEYRVIRGNHGASFEIGYLSREGEPIILRSAWNVSSVSLSMWAVPVTAGYQYYFAPYDRARTFAPYVGVGLGALLGGEKIGARATTLLKAWDGWTWGARGSMIGNLFLGARIAAWRGSDAVVEVRWTQGGRGWNVDLTEVEEKPTFDEYLYQMVRRPGFDFTGWSVSVGLSW